MSDAVPVLAAERDEVLDVAGLAPKVGALGDVRAGNRVRGGHT